MGMTSVSDFADHGTLQVLNFACVCTLDICPGESPACKNHASHAEVSTRQTVAPSFQPLSPMKCINTLVLLGSNLRILVAEQ